MLDYFTPWCILFSGSLNVREIFFFHSAEVVCIYFFQNHPSPPRGLIHLVTWRTWSTVSSLCQNTYVNYLKLSWKNAQNISKHKASKRLSLELCNPRFNIKKPTLGTWQGYHFFRMIYRRVSFFVLWNLKGPQRFGPRVGIFYGFALASLQLLWIAMQHFYQSAEEWRHDPKWLPRLWYKQKSNESRDRPFRPRSDPSSQSHFTG